MPATGKGYLRLSKHSTLLLSSDLNRDYLVPAVFLGGIHHRLYIGRFGVIHCAAGTQNEAAVLAHYLDELLAVLFNILWRTGLQYGRRHAALNAAMVP